MNPPKRSVKRPAAPDGKSRVAELFGERLRELRQAAGHTQESLAAEAGLPSTHISSIERGLMLPNLLTLLRVAAALDCKAAKLVSVFDEAGVKQLVER